MTPSRGTLLTEAFVATSAATNALYPTTGPVAPEFADVPWADSPHLTGADKDWLANMRTLWRYYQPTHRREMVNLVGVVRDLIYSHFRTESGDIFTHQLWQLASALARPTDTRPPAVRWFTDTGLERLAVCAQGGSGLVRTILLLKYAYIGAITLRYTAWWNILATRLNEHLYPFTYRQVCNPMIGPVEFPPIRRLDGTAETYGNVLDASGVPFIGTETAMPESAPAYHAQCRLDREFRNADDVLAFARVYRAEAALPAIAAIRDGVMALHHVRCSIYVSSTEAERILRTIRGASHTLTAAFAADEISFAPLRALVDIPDPEETNLWPM